jgi:hypothetical protein
VREDAVLDGRPPDAERFGSLGAGIREPLEVGRLADDRLRLIAAPFLLDAAPAPAPANAASVPHTRTLTRICIGMHLCPASY